MDSLLRVGEQSPRFTLNQDRYHDGNVQIVHGSKPDVMAAPLPLLMSQMTMGMKKFIELNRHKFRGMSVRVMKMMSRTCTI